jgi:hypothetical protein
MRKSDFREDRADGDAHNEAEYAEYLRSIEKHRTMRRRRFRSPPPRPSGFYLQYLESLIEKNNAKRNPATSDVAEEQYWRDRERHHAEQQAFKKAA